MAKLPFFLHSAEMLQRKLKCTVHKSGKLGFTTETSNALKIKEGMAIEIYTDEENATSLKAYMVILPEKTKDSFRINKAGSYYYGSTTAFFNKFFKDLGLDYAADTYSFELTEAELEGQKYYIMNGKKAGKTSREENEFEFNESLTSGDEEVEG